MVRLSDFENHLDRAMDGAAGALFKSPINPVQITKRAEKEMYHEKLVSAGRQYAPTLYNVLISPDDDAKLGGFYPTLSGELETYLKGKADESGLEMECNPLVRFIVDDGLRKGKFDVIAENVSGPIIADLRREEMERYGLATPAPTPAPREQRPQPHYDEMPSDSIPRGRHDKRNIRKSEPEPEPYVDPYLEEDFDADDGFNAGGGFDTVEDDPFTNLEDFDAAEQDADPFDAPVVPEMPSKSISIFQRRKERDAAKHKHYEPGPDDDKPSDSFNRYFGINSQDRGDFDTSLPDPTTQPRRGRSCTLFNTDTGQTYKLDGMRMSLGRDRNNDITVRDANVSRTHAEFTNDGGTWVIRDLGSTNGTFVSGREITSHPLHDGDSITVGMTNLEFREG